MIPALNQGFKRQPSGNSSAGTEFFGASNGNRQDRCWVSLPVRFEAADETADERRQVVDLRRERVVVRRCVGGMHMALNLPVSTLRGVVPAQTRGDEPPSAIDVLLEQGDPALSAAVLFGNH